MARFYSARLSRSPGYAYAGNKPSLTQCPAIIDAEQAAALLHCSKGQIELLAERGQLPATKFGRGWIFVTAQLIQCALTRCAENVRAGVRRAR